MTRQNTNIPNKVMIIDDDQFSVLLTKMKLKKYVGDENFVDFDNMASAKEYLESRILKDTAMIPDLILLEVLMNDGQGWDFISYFEEMIKAKGLTVQLVILTSSQFFSDYRKAASFKSVKGFLMKPLQKELLADICSGDGNNAISNVFLKSFIA